MDSLLSLTNNLLAILGPRQKFWQVEAMECPQEKWDQWGDESLRHALTYNDECKLQWETQHDFSALPDGREKTAIQEFFKLCHFPVPSKQQVPQEILRSLNLLHIKEKKVFELSEILAQLKIEHPQVLNQKFCEIGGGKGHLAYALAVLTQNQVMSVDRDAHLQELGRQRLQRYLPKQLSIEYIHQCLGPDLLGLPQKLGPQHFLFGLHTCGPLALFMAQLFFSSRSYGMLNFGCCYYHLNANTQVNLSAFFRATPFPWTMEALTLATRAHRAMTLTDYHFKNRVKVYRFCLHLFLREELGHLHRLKLGPSHKSLYQKNFGEYAMDNLKRVSLDSHFTSSQLQHFFDAPLVQLKLKQMMALQIYRNMWGRGLELIILLDRTMSWQEHGHRATLQAYFPEERSPRNLGILLMPLA